MSTVSKNLRVALVKIAKDDTGAGGLVPLTGSTFPLLYSRALQDEELPIITYFIVAQTEGTSDGKVETLVQFTTWSGPMNGATYIEDAEDIRARLETVLTNANLLGEGVDSAPVNPRWRDLPPDTDGVIGLVLEFDFFNAA